jgi:glycosyltransferase involved in cell wall biosynthesis
MRLLIGCPNVWWGGLQSWGSYLADWLPEDWTVGFAYWRGRPAAIEDLAEHGEALRIEGGELDGWGVDHGSLAYHARCLVRDWQPDVVQANCPTLAEAACANGVPCVTTGHSLRGAGANGSALADRAFRVSPAVPGNEPVILNGITPLAPPDERNEKTVVVATRLDRDRGPHLIFDALQAVLEKVPGSRFVFVGDNHDGSFDPPAELAARGVDEDRVDLLGQIAHGDALEVIRRADVICQPWPETFGQAVAEGMSAGAIPVVSIGGFGPQLMGASGFGASKRADSVAGALVNALTVPKPDEELRRRLAMERVREHFHARRFADAYRRVYEELATWT